MNKMIRSLACIPAIFCLGLASPQAQVVSGKKMDHPAIKIPAALQAEHQHLHAGLSAAINAGGRTGEAAREVEELLGPHFRKEEEYAMPLLGLLPSLSAGAMPAETKSVIAMSDRLKAELPEMLREHAAIAAAVQRLRTAARVERQREATQFAETLMSHALQEEQIHYPSAILVGEFLKAKR